MVKSKFWNFVGASVIGPKHIRDGLPNQDFWNYESKPEYESDMVVVCDGMGSKTHSDIGSRKACEAVKETFEDILINGELVTLKIQEMVQEKWLSLIEPNIPDECRTTCLFVFHIMDKVLFFQIGDGFIAYINENSEVVVPFRNYNEFSNISDSLSNDISENSWKSMILPSENIKGLILCTDGVGDDFVGTKLDSFFKDSFEFYKSLPRVQAFDEIKQMLENWPVPMHCDDKTIAYMYLDN